MSKYYYNKYTKVPKTWAQKSTPNQTVVLKYGDYIEYIHSNSSYGDLKTIFNAESHRFEFYDNTYGTVQSSLRIDENSYCKVYFKQPFKINGLRFDNYTDKTTNKEVYYTDKYYIRTSNSYGINDTEKQTLTFNDVILYETYISEYKAGDLVQSNIIAENGTYPDNGLADDGYWYVKEARVNTPPTITPTTSNLGLKAKAFSISYNIGDVDADNTLTATVKLDNTLLSQFTASRTSYTINLSDKWADLPEGIHTITVSVNDGQSEDNITSVVYTFEKRTKIEIQSVPIKTENAARNIQVRINSVGLNNTVYACNNAYDTEPTWEEILDISKMHTFSNFSKTSENWGVAIKIEGKVNN